jgi:lambda family phage minor tail protein L
MSSRAYDYKLTLTGLSPFSIGNTVIGLSSNTVAEIIDASPLQLKVKLANTYQSFIIGESIVSNTAILRSYNAFRNHSSNITGATNVFALPTTYSLVDLTDSITVYVDGSPAPRDSYVINANNTIQFLPVDTLSINTQNNITVYSDVRTTKIFPDSNVSSLFVQVVTGNVEAASFVSANFEGTLRTANSIIADITDSPYISEKNAINQSPIVKLYSIYYPGEWYPPNNAGNPSASGTGFPWPYGFPIRYAEVLGDEYYIQNPAVFYGGTVYSAQAIESDSIQIDGSGRIGEISLTVSNFDGAISELVENKNILGYNSTRSTLAIVNGELVQNIDPRTVSSNIFFNTSVQQSRGVNAAWDYESTVSAGDTWTPLRTDSRDLTGAVVDIVMTYAKFLDYWPEYSIVKEIPTNRTDWNLATAQFTGKFINMLLQMLAPEDLFFKPDGTKVFVIGSTSGGGSNDFVFEYSLSTPWDVSTATYIKSFSVSARDSIPKALHFKSDGLKMYVLGVSSLSVHEYNLSSAWDISTASYLQSLNVSSIDNFITSLFFKTDGLKMYITGAGTSDAVHEYNLSNAWDISTAILNTSFSVSAQGLGPEGLFIKSDGTKMYISDTVQEKVFEYTLNTPWSVSSAEYVQNLNVVSRTPNPYGVFFRDNMYSMYLLGDFSLDQYNLDDAVDVYSSDIYRVGDVVTSNTSSNTTTVTGIYGPTLTFSNNISTLFSANNAVYIVNPDADSSAHVKHTFVLNSLDELDEITAKFSLTSWLQYFKNLVPKRKFYSTTCPFVYKGEDCKYPATGTGNIAGSNPTVQANGFFTFGNVSTANIAEDICPKTLTACKLRRNLVNFGGFPNVQ